MSHGHSKQSHTGRTILLVLLLLLFIGAGILLVWHMIPPSEPADDPASSPDAVTTTTSSTQSSDTTTTTTVVLVDNPKDFPALQAKNPGIVGWISIPGTVVDYPILRSTPDQEENYYLHRDTDGSYKYAGSIYMQKINQPDFTDPNTVLYGHNMRNGSMFAALHKFKKADFFEKNQYIYVYAPGMILTYRIYSLFIYDNRHILNSFNFYNKDEYNTYLQYTLNPTSMTRQVREGVTVTTDDCILTLSTCTNRNTERLIMEGVLTNVQYTR